MRIQNTSPQFHKRGLLDDVVKLYAQTNPRYYSKFTTNRSTSNFFDRIATEGDFPVASIVAEGDAFDFADFATPYTMDVYPRMRGLANAASKLSLQNDPYGVLSRRASKMIDAVRKSMEYDAADLMNLATVAYTAGSTAPQVPDGLALASASHTLANGLATNIVTSGGTPNPALSYTALEGARQQFMGQVSHEGDPYPYDGPVMLLVPPALAGLAYRLTETERIAQTSDNDKNWAGRDVRVIVNPYFTSSTAWALVAAREQANPLVMLTRRGIVTDTDEEKIRDAVVLIVNAVWTKYAKDWRGFLYSAGA